MKNWKDPAKLVWHTVICPKCRKVASRVKLPAIQKQTYNRLCNDCGLEVALGENTGKSKRNTSKK